MKQIPKISEEICKARVRWREEERNGELSCRGAVETTKMDETGWRCQRKQERARAKRAKIRRSADPSAA